MPAKKSPSAQARKSKLSLSRVFAAPRSLVFAAWTQAKHMKQWSAPHGFKIPLNEGDLRPGGPWRAVMVMPDGTKLVLGGKYTKIIQDELLQFTHRWEGDPAPETLVTVHFADAPGGGTKLKFEQTGFTSAESRDGHGGGWKECFERLDVLLAKLTKKAGLTMKTPLAQPEDVSVPEIVNSRWFAASPERCFRAFSDPTQLACWWGPAGFTNTVPEFDFRVGGHWRIIMRGPDGAEYPNASEFLEIVPEKSAAFVHLGPMHRYWLRMTYEPENDGTRLTWRMRFATVAEHAKVKDFVAAANEQNFDRLASCLSGKASSIR